jgi:hypothetical protein
MENAAFKVYGYRWIVLSVFMLVVAVNQLLWITFAPITSIATAFYHVSDIKIGLHDIHDSIYFCFHTCLVGH